VFGVDGGGLLEGVDELGFDARLNDEDVHASIIGPVCGRTGVALADNRELRILSRVCRVCQGLSSRDCVCPAAVRNAPTRLKLETRVIEGERHAGNKPETFNRGLRFVFSD
jgi:hypothetical protein